MKENQKKEEKSEREPEKRRRKVKRERSSTLVLCELVIGGNEMMFAIGVNETGIP